jgi:membrane peptidoglycan carboxypeptidase
MVAGVLLLGSTAGGTYLVSRVLPRAEIRELARDNPQETAYMRLRGSTDPHVNWLSPDQVSPLLPCAIVAAEDRFFFDHRGFNWHEVMRAALAFGVTGQIHGGASTISQQLARNLYLGPQRTLQRKLTEALITIDLEMRLSKPRILELYLNTIEFGPDTWGMAAGADRYFGRTVNQLDVFEATLLASMVPAPRTFLVNSNADRASFSQERALARLYLSGAISAGEWSTAAERSHVLFAALKLGIPLGQAIAKASTVVSGTPPPEPPLYAPVPRDRLLKRGCGADRDFGGHEIAFIGVHTR